MTSESDEARADAVVEPLVREYFDRPQDDTVTMALAHDVGTKAHAAGLATGGAEGRGGDPINAGTEAAERYHPGSQYGDAAVRRHFRQGWDERGKWEGRSPTPGVSPTPPTATLERYDAGPATTPEATGDDREARLRELLRQALEGDAVTENGDWIAEVVDVLLYARAPVPEAIVEGTDHDHT